MKEEVGPSSCETMERCTKEDSLSERRTQPWGSASRTTGKSRSSRRAEAAAAAPAEQKGPEHLPPNDLHDQGVRPFLLPR
ncbi:Hypothetical protein NTJ_04279 [Nesidiocoris tenuis]|uniref:Uncharacterized protein n=1 Tax=Nesidiocoris tenuis TaxID=355587 RepID=A0ABN7AKQ4_9HEMI|nr:Hypothetical protein NTJ_04279 [Nesidiocoris tenuis]